MFSPDSSDTIPIVFSGCSDYENAESIYSSRSNIAGQLEPSSRIYTIDVATKIIPDYNSITILVDNTVTAKAVKAQMIEENVNNYPLTFITSNDYTYDELSTVLAKLTPKDIFMFVSCYDDSEGRKMTYIQSANFLCTTLNTPIFSTYSYNVNTVFAGGYVHDKVESGYKTGMIGSAMLYEGASAEAFGLDRDKHADMSYMFNIDILSDYDTDTSKIPQEALRILSSKTGILSESYPNLDKNLIYLSTFLGVCIFIFAGLALYRHNKAIHHEQIALTDPLTGAGSRFALSTKLDILIAYCKESDTRATLLFFDIDGFKTINDNYGHMVGDTILKQVIDRLQGVLGIKSDIYRYGGDEFVILIRMPASKAKGEIDRIVSAFDAPFSNGEISVPVNLSIGAAEIPEDGSDAQTLISKADTAMYAAKTFNATRVIFYSNLD